MTVNKRTRYEVLKRDNFTCRYCRSTTAELTVDHVVPVALGGTDDPDNLVTACRDCNYGKASTSPTEGTVEDVKNVDIKWAEAMKRAAEIQAAQREERDEYFRTFARNWGWAWSESSISAIYEAGLPADELIDAIYIAASARGVDNRFAYFCGVAWRKVRKMQEIAKTLLEADEVEAE